MPFPDADPEDIFDAMHNHMMDTCAAFRHYDLTYVRLAVPYYSKYTCIPLGDSYIYKCLYRAAADSIRPPVMHSFCLKYRQQFPSKWSANSYPD